ncbi:MAG: molybdopterin-dependent oxidoreductase [Bacteroidota bacterium]
MAEQTHYRTCNLCEAMCGLEIKYEGTEIKSIKGDAKDPFSKGFICPKAVALQDIYHDPDRLKLPQKRVGDQWETISWKQAYDEVEQGIKAVQEKYGDDAVGIYSGNPNVHNLGSMLFSSGLLKAIRTRNRFSATSVDQLPHHFASQWMLGNSIQLPVPDIDRTHYFLVFGANPLASNGSIMSAAGMPHRIKDLQERGGKMVVVDPRKSETALKADEHFFIRPGTDVYLLGAILNHLITNHPQDLPEYYKGYDELQELFAAFTADKVASITGVAAQEITRIAAEFANAESAVCYGRMGVSVQEHGALCQWIVYLINMVTGNFDSPGGMMCSNPAIDVVHTKPEGTMYSYGRWKSRVRGLPEFGNELPAAVMAEEMLNEGDGQIKAFICNAGNPVLSTPNGDKLDKALSGLEFMVSIDIYLNETSRHANIILPPATGLEAPHYDLVFHNLAVHNHTKFSPALFPIGSDRKYDWQIYKELGERFNKMSAVKKLADKLVTPEVMVDQGLKRGPYDIRLKDLRKNPHGVDLGPLQPVLPKQIFTQDRKVDMTPQVMVDGLKALSFDTPPEDKLQLIGRRHLRSNNTWMHNSERLVKGPKRCTAMIHPDDAEKLGIVNGELIDVHNEYGKVQIEAELTPTLMPGVISIPHGWGHNRDGIGWHTAKQHSGVSVNDLTSDQEIDAVSGNAAVNGVYVEVSKI